MCRAKAKGQLSLPAAGVQTRWLQGAAVQIVILSYSAAATGGGLSVVKAGNVSFLVQNARPLAGPGPYASRKASTLRQIRLTAWWPNAEWVKGSSAADVGPRIKTVFLQKSAPLGNSSWQCASKGLSLRTEALCVHEGHALIIVRQTALNWTTAECPQGHIIMSGGCVAKRGRTSHSLQASHPIREAWTCGGRGTQKTAYAVCIAEHNSTDDPTPVLVQQKYQQPQRKQHQQRLQKQRSQREAGGWKVSAGSCTIDVSEGRPCAMSPDFPKKVPPRGHMHLEA